MAHDPNDVVKVFSGTLMEVEAFQRVLADSGIESRVVGDELTAGLGTAIPGSVELWTHRSDAAKAVEAIQRDEGGKGEPHTGKRGPHGGKFPHPTSDPKPGPAPLRKEPHVKQDPSGQ